MQLPFGLGAMAAAARQCRECVNARAGDGYKCASPHPQHVVCSYCQQTFPSRNWPGTTCVGCTRSSCHPYFGDCGGGGDQLKPLRDHVPAAMPVGAILGIKCETDWFASYLSSKGIALAQVWTDCVDKLAANVFKLSRFLLSPRFVCSRCSPSLCRSTKWPNATDSSTFCSGCAVMVQRELLLQYRRGVPNDDVGPKRSNCHWGEACRCVLALRGACRFPLFVRVSPSRPSVCAAPRRTTTITPHASITFVRKRASIEGLQNVLSR